MLVWASVLRCVAGAHAGHYARHMLLHAVTVLSQHQIWIEWRHWLQLVEIRDITHIKPRPARRRPELGCIEWHKHVFPHVLELCGVGFERRMELNIFNEFLHTRIGMCELSVQFGGSNRTCRIGYIFES